MKADLERAASGVDAPVALCPLPGEVTSLLAKLDAPARLAAHLRAVHDVAVQLAAEFNASWPGLLLDTAAVAFGAATHDLGKSVHKGESTGAGSEHEEEGYRLLMANGVPDRLARFARTHARWADEAATNEDLLVSLADKVWKGKREDSLEQLVVGRIAAATGKETWSIFMQLDDVLCQITAQADERLAFQGSF
jgi:hypothetical protein